MFCRFGSWLDSRPVAATIWLKRRVDAVLGIGQRDQSVDGLAQLRAVAPGEQLLEQRVLGLGEQLLEGLGVGGVAGLDLLRLGQVALAEEDLLQLLGRAEVERPPHEPMRLLLGTPHVGAELVGQRRQAGQVDGDARMLHLREQRARAAPRRRRAGRSRPGPTSRRSSSTARSRMATACGGQLAPTRPRRCRSSSWSDGRVGLERDAQDALGDLGEGVAAMAGASR